MPWSSPNRCPLRAGLSDTRNENRRAIGPDGKADDQVESLILRLLELQYGAWLCRGGGWRLESIGLVF